MLDGTRQAGDPAHGSGPKQDSELLHLQDTIYTLWGTDRQPPVFRIFAGEQRALGEALLQTGARGPECMGYGAFVKAFVKAFDRGANPSVDAVRADVAAMGDRLHLATERLTDLQHALIDLLAMLDPEHRRFPADRRSKA